MTAIATKKGKSRLFYLPPYPPDRNPDELAWKHPKAGTASRTADFKRNVRSSMRQLQNDPKKNISSFQKSSFEYAA